MHDQNNPDEREFYNHKERKRNKNFRRGDSNPSVSANYLAKNSLSELQREEHWEENILNEFELGDDRELDNEDSRNKICEMLAKEP